jgi:hypothetical protein
MRMTDFSNFPLVSSGGFLTPSQQQCPHIKCYAEKNEILAPRKSAEPKS